MKVYVVIEMDKTVAGEWYKAVFSSKRKAQKFAMDNKYLEVLEETLDEFESDHISG
jgi:hypothetical protein